MVQAAATVLAREAGVLDGPDGVVIDLEGYQVWRDGVAVSLTRKECELLQCLATKPGAVFSRLELLVRLDEKRARTLDVYVCRLRRKLNDQRAAYIQTVRKVGYRLNAPGAPVRQLR